MSVSLARTINAASLNDLLRFALELTGLAALAWFGLIVGAGVWSTIIRAIKRSAPGRNRTSARGLGNAVA